LGLDPQTSVLWFPLASPDRNNSLNSMPCSNNDHVDKLDFLENEKGATFMFELPNFMP
jgi:hypothetical protein